MSNQANRGDYNGRSEESTSCIAVTVLSNDTDADGDGLFILSFTPTGNGLLVANGDGTLSDGSLLFLLRLLP